MTRMTQTMSELSQASQNQFGTSFDENKTSAAFRPVPHLASSSARDLCIGLILSTQFMYVIQWVHLVSLKLQIYLRALLTQGAYSCPYVVASNSS